MNFILDSGSGYIIITNLETIEELNLSRGKEVQLKGLGSGYTSTAYYSKNNKVSLGKIVNNKADVVLLFNSDLNLSQRMGIPIHGVIGYDIFKSLVLDINYKSQRIKYYEPEYFYAKNGSKLSDYKEHDLKIKGKKSYIELEGAFPAGDKKKLDLLIDTGSWDALWLFEKEEIAVPEKNVEDFLGYGLSGPINGKRAKISKIEIAKEVLNAPTTSFPDSISIGGIAKGLERDGSIGSEVFRRFNVIFDYSNKKIYLKKNKSIKDKFYYNMAGLELSKSFPLIPVYEVIFVRENSPAYMAGLRKGDIIQNINNQKPDEEISLNDVYKMFRKQEGKKVVIGYTRGSTTMKYVTFTLKKLI